MHLESSERSMREFRDLRMNRHLISSIHGDRRNSRYCARVLSRCIQSGLPLIHSEQTKPRVELAPRSRFSRRSTFRLNASFTP